MEVNKIDPEITLLEVILALIIVPFTGHIIPAAVGLRDAGLNDPVVVIFPFPI